MTNAGSILKRNFFISEMRTSLGFQFLPWKCTARHYRRRDGYFQQNEPPKNCENQNSVIRDIENQEVNLLSKEELCKRQNQIRWMSFYAIF